MEWSITSLNFSASVRNLVLHFYLPSGYLPSCSMVTLISICLKLIHQFHTFLPYLRATYPESPVGRGGGGNWAFIFLMLSFTHIAPHRCTPWKWQWPCGGSHCDFPPFRLLPVLPQALVTSCLDHCANQPSPPLLDLPPPLTSACTSVLSSTALIISLPSSEPQVFPPS